jgi:FKBP-type peptidyl-prolyl cis-trans isomerase FkpA
MTEITRVPLLPIARGSMSKLWLGVAVAVLGGAGLAYAGKPPLVDVQTITPGTGPSPVGDDFVMVNYQGRLANGVVFDQAQHAIFPLQRVVPGFTKALEQMQAGGKYVVKIPAKLGYGDKATGPIPANSDLTFTVELVDFKTAAEIEQQQRMMEQMRAMQAQQGGAAAPTGAPAGAPTGAMPADPSAGAVAPR